MNGIPLDERKALGALLDQQSQEAVMAKIPQFAKAEMENFVPAPAQVPEGLGVLMFNMERGIHLAEIQDFLQDCPDIQPFDVILANELDDGCARSGNKNTSRELAQAFGLNYAWGLEFIELVNDDNEKGFHGNAVFSRWPIRRAGVIRLPEQYNWYFDRQRRIGGRLAVYAELDIGGRPLGVVSIHLENRTHGEGRKAQMKTILESVRRELPGIPVILGGDLNTNTFDGRSKEDIGDIAGSPALRRRCLEDVFDFEPLLPLSAQEGYQIVPEEAKLTRRKPLPGGDFLPLRLDWLLLKGISATQSHMVSTARKDLTYARPGSALAAFSGDELSDHNAIWASCRLDG
jgi:endonuclease/exonuclease/phosphatase family metal-dependent hydrolase